MLTTEEMKKIALKNLCTLNAYPEVIKRFKEDENDVWCSERCALGAAKVGILYDTTQSNYTYKKEVDAALAYVRKQGDLPYHVIQTNMEFGNTFAVLYVSHDEEEDSVIGKDAFIGSRSGYRVYAYVYNADEEDFSEYGGIAIKESGGGLIRTA
jgi:hypothetical protein